MHNKSDPLYGSPSFGMSWKALIDAKPFFGSLFNLISETASHLIKD